MTIRLEEDRMTRFATLPCCLLAALLTVSVSLAEPPPNMTTYYLGVLVKGPNWSAADSPERVKIQEGQILELE
jgi:hypothetical protein